MVTTYFLREHTTYNPTADVTVLRIWDRNTILVSTHFGCVYITREEALRVLRNYRARCNNPTFFNGEQINRFEYEKTVTL